MIKNASEAREIISTFKNKPAYIKDIADYENSKGYLAALEGPEVRELLEGIQNLIDVKHENTNWYRSEAMRMLEKFRASTKEPLK